MDEKLKAALLEERKKIMEKVDVLILEAKAIDSKRYKLIDDKLRHTKGEEKEIWGAEEIGLWEKECKVNGKIRRLKREANKIFLDAAWKERLKLLKEADRAWIEGDMVLAQTGSMTATTMTLRSKARKLWAEGKDIFQKAVIETCGNIEIDWKGYNHCILENGDEFR